MLLTSRYCEQMGSNMHFTLMNVSRWECTPLSGVRGQRSSLRTWARLRDSRITSPTVLSVVVRGMVVVGGWYAPAVHAAGAPGSVNVGPLEVTPNLGLEAQHRSNIYRRPSNETSDIILRATPSIIVAAQERLNTYTLSYDGDYGYFQDNLPGQTNDYNDHRINAAAHVEPTSRWIVEVEAGWGDIHEDRGTGLSEGAIGQGISEPITFEQATAGVSVTYGAKGAGRIQAVANSLQKEYQNFRSSTAFRDYSENTLGANVFFPVAPKTDITVQYQRSQTEYPIAAGSLPSFDSTIDTISTGAVWEASAGLTSSARVGYTEREFDDAGRVDFGGLFWSLDLQLQPNSRTLAFIQGAQETVETMLVGDFIYRRALRANISRDLGAFTSLDVRASYTRDSYEGTTNNRTDDLINAGIRVNYSFWRQAPIYIQYSYEEKDSTVGALSYTDHVLAVGFTFGLP